jgi:putative oxidoreductase
MRVLYGLGRAVLGGFFIYNGLNHLTNTEPLEGYAAAKQVQNPHTSVVGTGALMAAAGTSLLLGVKPKLGAVSLIGFLAVASAQMHDFWNSQNEQEKQNEVIQFSKNIALIGALLTITGDKYKAVKSS